MGRALVLKSYAVNAPKHRLYIPTQDAEGKLIIKFRSLIAGGHDEHEGGSRLQIQARSYMAELKWEPVMQILVVFWLIDEDWSWSLET
jgi:hypothetical protein